MAPHRPFPKLLAPLLLALAALVLLAAAPATRPPAAPSSARLVALSPAQDLAEADTLRHAGDFQAAAERYRALAETGDAAVRRQARLGLGETLLASGEDDAAEEALAQVVASGDADELRGRALVRLAGLRRDQGDCRAALALLHEAAPLLPLGPYLALQRAACYAQLGEHEQALAEARAALQQATTPPQRVDALERLALTSLDLDRREDAARWYAELVPAASTESFRAQARYRLGQLDRELGRTASAVQLFRAVAVDQPAQPAAAAALEALQEMGRQTVISYAQAGQVYFNRGRLAEAGAALASSLADAPDGPEAAQARYTLALTRLRRGDEQGAAEALIAMAERHPESPLAPAALLRAGRVLESLGLHERAAEAFQRLADVHQAAPQSAEARSRLGFVRWLQRDLEQAHSTWSDLAADDGAAAPQRGLAELWLGLTTDGEAPSAVRRPSSVAQQHWLEAVRLDPHGYAGVRAAARLAEAGADGWQPGPPPSFNLTLSTWLRQRGHDWAALQAELAASPSYRLASLLWSVGLEPEAGRELFTLADALAREPERLLALSALLAQPPTQHLSLNFANRAVRAIGVPLAELPAELLRLLYPLPYEALLRADGQRFGVDPLLLAALARQESTFNPSARSVAGALGLTQVMPQTGQLIARALGAADFQPSDLLRPTVSLEFGAWYLSGRLARYQGRVLPALAAYNAGDGAVNAWLVEYCDDPDCFAERIPYQETHRYARVVLENYHQYQRLYGDR